MGKTVYDIDAVLERHQGFVRLRGDEYRIADATVRERLEIQRRWRESDSERGQAELAKGMLDGIPDELAEDLTAREFMLINRAYEDFFNPDDLDFEDDEVKNV